jgi:hypothetical protein
MLVRVEMQEIEVEEDLVVELVMMVRKLLEEMVDKVDLPLPHYQLQVCLDQ